jgi:hypothetical protein
MRYLLSVVWYSVVAQLFDRQKSPVFISGLFSGLQVTQRTDINLNGRTHCGRNKNAAPVTTLSTRRAIPIDRLLQRLQVSQQILSGEVSFPK